MHSLFYIGIVENRNDPLKLGRCQVRIFGTHSESKFDVPTKDLPWAIPVMPNIGSSISGVGNSSSLIEGTTVLVFFQDNESKQEPIILGSLHGVPINQSPFSKENKPNETILSVTENDKIVTASSEGVVESEKLPEKEEDKDFREALKKALGQKESSNNYKAVNQFNYLGKYQFGAAMLTDLGYVKKGSNNRALNDTSSWTGKDGINSKEDFLNSQSVQESAIDAELDLNTKRLKKMSVITNDTSPEEVSGYLATSHLLGTGGARDMKAGISKKDGNGVSGEIYYALGYKAASGKTPIVSPPAATKDNPYNVPAKKQDDVIKKMNSGEIINQNEISNLGFSDPAGKFPRKEHLKEQDTNRLYRNQNIEKTIVPYKEETRDRNVPIANNKGAWNQSQVPYNTRHPYNRVMETESGHILEFDDTPENERIHEWHKSGTFREIDRNGTEVRKIVGDSYEILERNGYVHIKGTCNITVEGNANILVANNLDLEVDGNMNCTVGGNMNWSVGGNIKIKSGGSEHHSNGSDHSIDATQIHLNSGRSTAGSIPGPYKTASGEITFDNLVLPTRAFETLSEFESDELTSEQAEERQKTLEDSGLIDVNKEPPIEGENTKVDKNDVEAPIQTNPPKYESGNIPLSTQLSPNYKLGDLTKGREVVDQSGLKDTEIVENLRLVANNILELIKAKYPNIIITSGLRSPGTNLSSQHPTGQAVDIQFTGVSSSQYLNIVKDLASFLPYDQLLLEYRTDKRNGVGEPTTWVHISHRKTGNRKDLFTMNNDKRISDFGQLKEIR